MPTKSTLVTVLWTLAAIAAVSRNAKAREWVFGA